MVFQSQCMIDSCKVAMIMRIGLIPQEVLYKHTNIYGQELSLPKMISTLMEISKEKYLGMDGYTCELFRSIQDYIRRNLLRVYKDVINKNYLGFLTNKGIIKFIPKGHDPKIMTSQRLITLLNASSNVLDKPLALRLQCLIPHITRLKQTRFICRRLIIDIVVEVWGTLEWGFPLSLSLYMLTIKVLDYPLHYSTCHMD